jgi:hypothetical protein
MTSWGPKPVLDDSLRLGQNDDEYQRMQRYEQPLLDPLVREIEQEVEQMREAGTLRPFVEGEPIGVIPRLVAPRPRPVVDKSRRMEEKRAEMLALRRRNDAVMRSLTT